MLSRVKKYFFNFTFFALYAAFAFQIGYVIWLAVKGGCDDFIGDFGWLTGEWLALMAARYLSRRSGGSSMHHGQPPRRF